MGPVSKKRNSFIRARSLPIRDLPFSAHRWKQIRCLFRLCSFRHLRQRRDFYPLRNGPHEDVVGGKGAQEWKRAL